jgi:spherulation-specific family 4 protein
MFATLALATGVLVPLYVDPNSAWTTVASAKQQYPSVPVVAIINPASGPGPHLRQTYVRGVRSLHAAGVIVLGYVHTSYGRRPLAVDESEMAKYHRWYGVDGIFLDEMANTAGHEAYYSTLTAFAKSLGMQTTIGNPGTDTLPSYIGTVTSMDIYESAGYPSLSFLSGGWHGQYPKSNFGFISYAVQTLNPTLDQQAAAYVGYEYVTNQRLPNPYAALPPYFMQLVASLVGFG